MVTDRLRLREGLLVHTNTHTHTTHQRPITVLGIKTSKNKIYYGFFAFVDTLPEQRRKIKIGPIYIKTVLFRFLSFSIILITSHFTAMIQLSFNTVFLKEISILGADPEGEGC